MKIGECYMIPDIGAILKLVGGSIGDGFRIQVMDIGDPNKGSNWVLGEHYSNFYVDWFKTHGCIKVLSKQQNFTSLYEKLR